MEGRKQEKVFNLQNVNSFLLMTENLKKKLLENKVHFGHMSKKWNPKMSRYIFMKKNDNHIIDLNKTVSCLKSAAEYIKCLAKSGKKILFIGTKDQAKDVIEKSAESVNMPYVAERWLGGTLTNFGVIKKKIKSLQVLEKRHKEKSYQFLTKKEKLVLSRQEAKFNILLKGLKDMTRHPAAVFVVDISKEKNAVLEARSLKIPVIAIVDTNVNPDYVDVPIPGNDDSLKSISVITDYLVKAIGQGLEERFNEAKREKEEVSVNNHSSDSNKNDKKILAKIDTKEIKKENSNIKKKIIEVEDKKTKKEVEVNTSTKNSKEGVYMQTKKLEEKKSTKKISEKKDEEKNS